MPPLSSSLTIYLSHFSSLLSSTLLLTSINKWMELTPLLNNIYVLSLHRYVLKYLFIVLFLVILEESNEYSVQIFKYHT